jgi:hypothetical protein
MVSSGEEQAMKALGQLTRKEGFALGLRLAFIAGLGLRAAVGTANAACPSPVTYTVTNTSSSAATSGSLPWAVAQANTDACLDFISFSIPGSGVHSITLTSTLNLVGQVVINGKSQPGYTSAPLIYVKGSALQFLFVLSTGSSGSTIQGLGLYDYAYGSIAILNGSQGNWIQDNYLGFYNDGTPTVLLNRSAPASHANSVGMAIQSSFNTIRGNTISGVSNGIVMGEDVAGPWSGTQYKTNSIQGNKVGTNPAGTSATGYGNDSDGIFLGEGAIQNFLGPNNVLSGNASSGAELFHSSVVGNVVFASRIGTNDAGTAAIPNGELGVLLANGANGNAVGGPFGGSVISANTFGGVSLGSTGVGAANGNWVQNNLIGVNMAQTASLGGQQVGISINTGSTRNDVENNVLAGHSQHGAILSACVTNSVSNNYIGRSVGGTLIPNAGFGVFFLNASNNYATGNLFGTNTLGNFGSSGTSSGNVFP